MSATKRVPLWQQVLDDLERRLSSGEFGSRFPTDRELVEHYGTSRHTVREAVRHLKARGVIERERGRGSTVMGGPVPNEVGALYNLFAAVEKAGHTQESEVLALDMRPDAYAAERFGFEPSTPLVHLERLRLIDGMPLALDTVWLAPDIGRPLLEADFAHTSLYDELAERSGVKPSSGQETITAVVADEELREVLDLQADEAVLRVERVTSHADRVIECRLTLLRSSMVALVTSWPGGADVDAVVYRPDVGEEAAS